MAAIKARLLKAIVVEPDVRALLSPEILDPSALVVDGALVVVVVAGAPTFESG